MEVEWVAKYKEFPSALRDLTLLLKSIPNHVEVHWVYGKWHRERECQVSWPVLGIEDMVSTLATSSHGVRDGLE